MPKKILTWIDSNLVYFGICKSLKENYDCELYGIFDTTDKPKKFLKTQNIVTFKKSWFYDELIQKLPQKPDIAFLKKFESEHNLHLWLLARNDRILYNFNDFYNFSSDEVLSIIEKECRSFEKILNETKPDFVILYHPTLRQEYLFYLICRSKNIQTLILRTTRLPNKFIITNDHLDIGFKNNHELNSPNTHTKNLSEVHEEYFKINTANTSAFKKFRNSKKDFFLSLCKYFLSENSNPKTHYTYYGRTKTKVFLKYIKYALQSKFRKNFIDKNFVKNIDTSKPYAYFPLHIEQERSTLLDAPFHTNQLEVIKQIVKSLPIGMSLYVKEHPIMKIRNWRSISEYRELLSLPNVTVLHPSSDSNNLLQNCQLVFVITGTVGLEAGFYNKPAITFAKTEYSFLNHVYEVGSIVELPKIINIALESKFNSEIIQYVNFLKKMSFDYDMIELQQSIQDLLTYGGNLVDVEINPKSLSKFLDDKRDIFNNLANEYAKKIF